MSNFSNHLKIEKEIEKTQIFWEEDTKNKIIWCCLQEPYIPAIETNNKNTPAAMIPPLIGQLVKSAFTLK